MKRILPLALLLLGTGSCAWPFSQPEPVDPVAEFIRHLEEARRGVGCSEPLIWDRSIEEVARRHNTDMMVSNRIRHVNANGEDVGTRLEKGGVHFAVAAENLAAGPVRGRRVYQLWYDSPGHRRNMLNCTYTHHGVAYEYAWWTHVLVRYPPSGGPPTQRTSRPSAP